MAICEINRIPELKTINEESLIGNGDISIPTKFKTINGEDLRGDGDITINPTAFKYGVCDVPVFEDAGSVDIDVDFINKDMNPILTVIVDSAEDKSEIYKTWAHIYRADANENGKITFYSDGKTSRAIQVQILAPILMTNN